jgi:hypothetical protein
LLLAALLVFPVAPPSPPSVPTAAFPRDMLTQMPGSLYSLQYYSWCCLPSFPAAPHRPPPPPLGMPSARP